MIRTIIDTLLNPQTLLWALFFILGFIVLLKTIEKLLILWHNYRRKIAKRSE
jgi:hypothetical protein